MLQVGTHVLHVVHAVLPSLVTRATALRCETYDGLNSPLLGYDP